MKNYILRITALLLFVTSFSACMQVKEYQKNKINDAEMALNNRRVERNELSFQSYLESSAGANAGKTGGGCGCN